MKSRFRVLQTLGTLSLVLAYILLILGIVAAFGAWAAVRGLGNSIDLPGWVSVIGIVPPLLWGILGFLQFFIVGKVLQLLVGMDETTLNIAQELRQHTVPSTTIAPYSEPQQAASTSSSVS